MLPQFRSSIIGGSGTKIDKPSTVFPSKRLVIAMTTKLAVFKIAVTSAVDGNRQDRTIVKS
jgi:hypothetical protein